MLKNVKVGMKLTLGFGILIIIAIVLSSFGIITVRKIEHVSNMKGIANKILVAELQSKAERKEYLNSGKEERKQLFMDYVAEMEEDISMMRNITQSDDVVRMLNDITAETKKYRSIFEKVTQVSDFSQGYLNKDNAEFLEANDVLIKSGRNLFAFVDGLAEYEDAMMQSTMRQAIFTLLAVLVVAVILGIIIAIIMTRALTVPIRQIQEAAEQIALGNLEDVISIHQTDEIGSLADSFREMQSGLKDKAKVAEKIALGDTEVEIVIASEVDVLGKAMVGMRESLSKKADVANKVANGDLNVVVEVMSNKDQLGASMVTMVENLKKSQEEVKTAMDQVEAGLKEAQAVVNEVNRVAEQLRVGNLKQRAHYETDDKAFQQLISGFNSAIENILEPVNESVKVLALVAKGDLTRKISGEYQGDHNLMKNALNETIDSLNETLEQVQMAMDQVAAGASQVSASSQTLSQGAAEQASSLEEITSSMTEMGSQTSQNAENADSADRLVADAAGAAEEGNSRMEQMLDAMREINDSSKEIGRIIKVIDEIAFQTNLLALNAAVEAARAGVHGKGFAVVADEVRNLAQRSATAAKETTELIEGSTQKVDVGSKIAEDTATALQKIVTGVKKVNDLIGDIAASSNEQTQGINQINDALGQIDDVTQANTTNAEESASASEELSSQADHVKSLLEKFKLASNGGNGIRKPTKKKSLPGSRTMEMPARSPKDPAMQRLKDELSPEAVIRLDDDDFEDF